MKTKGVCRGDRALVLLRTGRWGALTLVVVATGCATGKSSLSNGRTQTPAVLAEVEPGPLGMTSPLEPASFAYEPGSGLVESPGEGAANAARAVLTTPNLLHPQLEAAVGAVEFVLAPFAAGYGALNAGHRRLTPDKLAETDKELTEAMRSMAAQERLRELLLERAGQMTRRRLVPVEPSAAQVQSSEPVSAVLETTVESLRLQRTGAGDSTYALRMRARARVVRATDGAVLFARPYEFRSEPAMFIDWARPGGFESVAQTGYRDLAGQMSRDLFAVPSGEPVVFGPGCSVSTPWAGNSSSRHGERGGVAEASFNASTAHRKLVMKDDAPTIALAAYHPADDGAFEIYSGRAMPDLLVQRPPTRAEAAAEASTETEWLLGGLEDDRNSVVQLAACLAAVPFGLWEQSFGLLRRRSPEALGSAGRTLSLEVRRMRPQEVLADDFARALAPRSSFPVAVVKDPLRARNADQPALVPCSYQGVPGRLADSPAGTALEINLVEARLARAPGFRSRLALCVDARVTLIRKSDGQELYTFPVTYRGLAKSLKAWAKSDAPTFRGELSECCRELGAAAAQQVVACGLVSPRRDSAPVFAQR